MKKIIYLFMLVAFTASAAHGQKGKTKPDPTPAPVPAPAPAPTATIRLSDFNANPVFNIGFGGSYQIHFAGINGSQIHKLFVRDSSTVRFDNMTQAQVDAATLGLGYHYEKIDGLYYYLASNAADIKDASGTNSVAPQCFCWVDIGQNAMMNATVKDSSGYLVPIYPVGTVWTFRIADFGFTGLNYFVSYSAPFTYKK